MKLFKYQEPEFYARLFCGSKRGPFEVPTCCTKKYEIKKSVPGALKLYVLQEINNACVLFSLSSSFFFIGDKIDTDCFKYEIKPSLKSNYRIKFCRDVAMNRVRDQGKP